MEENIDREKLPSWLIMLNIVLIVAIVWLFFLIYEHLKTEKVARAEEITELVASPIFNSVNIGAKSAYVFDINQNKILFKKNEDAQLPLASLTKLMMATVATDLLSKDSKITINREFLSESGDNGLIVDESWTLKDLLDFSLVASSNDASRAIASVAGSKILETDNYDLGRSDFIERMNQKAKDLGLVNMYFINESGLDINTYQSGGYGTAEEVAKLMSYILKNKPELLEMTKKQVVSLSSDFTVHNISNTNQETGYIPNIIGSKTGYTELAGGNLAVAFDAEIGRPVIVVVLGSTVDQRFTDVKNLTDAVFQYVLNQ